MLRCQYCARILKINRSDTYLLCSQKCKSKFKNKNQIKKVDEYVLGSINNEWYFVKDIVLPKKSNKFEIVSSISRMIYFENRLIKKNNDEVNLETRVTLKKK